MKVMIIQLPHFYDGIFRPSTSYPLGIGYLVSVLKQNYECVPMDLWIDNSSTDRAVKLIKKSIPDIFFISVYSTQYPYLKELVKILKEEFPSLTIVAGGPGATFSYRIILEKTGVDYCVIGEGEITSRELLDNISNPEDIAGLAYIKNGKTVLTHYRDQIKELDSIPLPDRSFFDIEHYIQLNKKGYEKYKNFRATNMIAGRGCPYSCTYCSKTFRGARFRSGADIDTEIKLIKKEFGLEVIEFHDELVTVNKTRTLEICSFMKKNNLLWGCQGRINLVDKDMLKAMKDSGCINIGYGVESYSQKILDKMNKKIKVEDIIPVIELTKKIGIKPIIQYMYGFSGEDDGTLKDTEKFFKLIDHPYIGFITTPIPGTQIYKEAVEEKKIVDEEEYLFHLTSGYNRTEPLVNLTDFSMGELKIKQKELRNKINRRYYLRHPIQFCLYFFGKVKKALFLLFFDPLKFINKINRILKNFNH